MRRKSSINNNVYDFLGPSPRKALLFWAQKMHDIFLRPHIIILSMEAVLDA